MRHARLRFLKPSLCDPPQSPGVLVAGLVSAESLPWFPPVGHSARRRRPARGSLGPHCPTCPGLLRRYDCPLPRSGACAGRSFPDTLPASLVRGLPSGLGAWAKRPDSARTCGHPVPQSGHGRKETGGSPTFPRAPSEDMPRSQTPGVSCARAKTHPGLRPSSHWQPSAAHDSPHCGAPSRGLSPRYTRLRTAPYGEARGVTPDRLARLSSGRTCNPAVLTYWGTTTHCMALRPLPRFRAYLGATSAWFGAAQTGTEPSLAFPCITACGEDPAFFESDPGFS